MRLTVGKKVVYPCQGPCMIVSIVERVVADSSKSFYRLALLDERGGELFAPVEKAKVIGIRPLLKAAEIPKLLGRLMTSTKIAKDWKQRASDTSKRFTSGSVFDLAEIVASLTLFNETKALSLRESWILARARTLLVCEIAEVLGETKNMAEQRVTQALKAQKAASVVGIPNPQPIRNFSQSL